MFFKKLMKCLRKENAKVSLDYLTLFNPAIDEDIENIFQRTAGRTRLETLERALSYMKVVSGSLE